MLVVLAAIGLGWMVSDRVARPLLQITADLERIGRFDFSSEPASRSFIHEIAVVSDGVDRMKTSLRSFSHYVPVDLVRDVIASGKEARLSGATRELTLFVSDIAGFTAISERLAPDELVTQLAQYLEEATAAIRAEGGTIDKFVGDGIVAFFNAPTMIVNHPAAACRAALAMQAAVGMLNKRWAAIGSPALPTRIGLNTGEVVVGNFGTRDRFAYTAMGDAMNLASRLEGLNKTYGTAILASESVWRKTSSEFEWRRLDRVAVVGRHQSTLVFELLGKAGEVSQRALDSRHHYEAGLEAFFAGRLSEAAASFALANRLLPGDRAAELMMQRTLELAANSPRSERESVFYSKPK
jgi:adenylate cyclase